MCKKTLDACRTGSEFLAFARSHGAEIRNGKGSHTIVSTQRGQTVVPVHSGDIGKGLACKIRKQLALILLALMPLTCLLSALLS
jgi:predicted RNA binding protein YcfA (HicA-like mRNA interferase family)